MIEPLSDADQYIFKTPLMFDQRENQENVFKISKIDGNLVQKILFVRSGILQLRLFLDKFQNRNTLQEDDIIRTQKTLQLIIDFIFGLEEGHQRDYFDLQLEPIQENQMILKDIQLIDILMDIFIKAFERYKIQEFNPKQKDAPFFQQNELLLQFIRISFCTMKYTISEFRPNELYASQWLDFLMKHTLENTEQCDTFVGFTLTELIDNNTKILESRIKEGTILSIVRGMRFDTTNLYFIGLLRALCICNGKPVFKNQQLIIQALLNEDTYKDRGFNLFTND